MIGDFYGSLVKPVARHLNLPNPSNNIWQFVAHELSFKVACPRL